MTKLSLEILPNDKIIPSFVFCYQFCLIIQKIKAKFLVGENKCVGIAKIYEYLAHIQVRFDIAHR